MSVEQQNNVKNGLSLRKVVVCILIAAAFIFLLWNFNKYEYLQDTKTQFIFLLPFLFGVVLVIFNGGFRWLNYGLPLINLVAIYMWLYCLFIFTTAVDKKGIIKNDIGENAYFIPLVLISIIIVLLLEYAAYLLKKDNPINKSVLGWFSCTH